MELFLHWKSYSINRSVLFYFIKLILKKLNRIKKQNFYFHLIIRIIRELGVNNLIGTLPDFIYNLPNWNICNFLFKLLKFLFFIHLNLIFTTIIPYFSQFILKGILVIIRSQELFLIPSHLFLV